MALTKTVKIGNKRCPIPAFYNFKNNWTGNIRNLQIIPNHNYPKVIFPDYSVDIKDFILENTLIN